MVTFRGDYLVVKHEEAVRKLKECLSCKLIIQHIRRRVLKRSLADGKLRCSCGTIITGQHVACHKCKGTPPTWTHAEMAAHGLLKDSKCVLCGRGVSVKAAHKCQSKAIGMCVFDLSALPATSTEEPRGEELLPFREGHFLARAALLTPPGPDGELVVSNLLVACSNMPDVGRGLFAAQDFKKVSELFSDIFIFLQSLFSII